MAAIFKFRRADLGRRREWGRQGGGMRRQMAAMRMPAEAGMAGDLTTRPSGHRLTSGEGKYVDKPRWAVIS